MELVSILESIFIEPDNVNSFEFWKAVFEPESIKLLWILEAGFELDSINIFWVTDSRVLNQYISLRIITLW